VINGFTAERLSGEIVIDNGIATVNGEEFKVVSTVTVLEAKDGKLAVGVDIRPQDIVLIHNAMRYEAEEVFSKMQQTDQTFQRLMES